MFREIGELPKSAVIDEKIMRGGSAEVRNLEVNGKNLVLKEYRNKSAKQVQGIYKRFLSVFGKEHTAKTLVVIGKDVSPNQREQYAEDHVYQERLLSPIKILFPKSKENLTAEWLQGIKQKSFDELDNNDPLEAKLKAMIESHKKELADYYEVCFEAALCGVKPDLRPHNDQAVLSGYLLNENLGFDSEGQIKWFDFDHAPYFFPSDVKVSSKLVEAEMQKTNSVKERIHILENKPTLIKKIIETHKKKEEYPAKFVDGEVVLSQWYKDIFEIGSEKAIVEALSFSSIGPELESLRRLVGTTPYGTKAKSA